MNFKHASYGGTVRKSGGGKLDAVTKGGAPPNLPGKASGGPKKGGIVSPTTKGDKGVPPMHGGGGSKKAPRD